MTLWNEHRALSEDFLTQHHDLVLYDVFHRVVAFLLYPPRCSCESYLCQCDSIRARITLSLNLDFYNKLQERNEDSEFLIAARLLLKIPEVSYFQKHYTNAYPSWLIDKDLSREEKNFNHVNQLAWTLLRLFKTHQLSIFRESKTSINESLEVIFGKTPVKTKRKKGSKKEDLGGEHAHKKQFKRYKAVSHFIVALYFMKIENKQEDTLLFFQNQPDRISQFLSLAHWFREKFLLLQTPNTKKKDVFLEEEILPLPSWVNSQGIDIPIEPFEEKLEEINAPYVEYLNSKSA